MDWPKLKSQFITASDFQDSVETLTFLSWEKKSNDDDPSDKKFSKTWKEKLKYQLRYSYPKFAIDKETGEQMIGRDGQPFENSNWDENFPHGYSIKYTFKEGVFESGSYPLFKAFCKIQPKANDVLEITKTGKDKDTVWSVKFKDIQMGVENVKDELKPDEDVPF